LPHSIALRVRRSHGKWAVDCSCSSCISSSQQSLRIEVASRCSTIRPFPRPARAPSAREHPANALASATREVSLAHAAQILTRLEDHAGSVVGFKPLTNAAHYTPPNASLHQTLLANPSFAVQTLLLRLEHDFLHLHLIENIITFNCLAQRHNLVRHEPS
jgi:hypothetical protein